MPDDNFPLLATFALAQNGAVVTRLDFSNDGETSESRSRDDLGVAVETGVPRFAFVVVALHGSPGAATGEALSGTEKVSPHFTFGSALALAPDFPCRVAGVEDGPVAVVIFKRFDSSHVDTLACQSWDV
jgi:hypothetical protein